MALEKAPMIYFQKCQAMMLKKEQNTKISFTPFYLTWVLQQNIIVKIFRYLVQQ